MVQDAPELVAVEIVAFILNVSILHREGVKHPEGNVSNRQERD